MSDELLLRRLRIGWHDDDTPIWVSDAMVEAAYRIEALTAERDGLLRCVTDNHVALCRAEAAEAERDRLRKFIEDIISDCEADYPPSHGAIKYAAKLALKGDSRE